MKKYLVFLLVTLVVCFSVTSCVNNTQTIQAEANAANRQCPQDLGNGLTLTKVDFEGRYVVYYIKGTEDMSFCQDDATPEMKYQIVRTLQIQAQNNESMKKFIEALKKENIGVLYHYYTSSDQVMNIVVEAEDL